MWHLWILLLVLAMLHIPPRACVSRGDTPSPTSSKSPPLPLYFTLERRKHPFSSKLEEREMEGESCCCWRGWNVLVIDCAFSLSVPLFHWLTWSFPPSLLSCLMLAWKVSRAKRFTFPAWQKSFQKLITLLLKYSIGIFLSRFRNIFSTSLTTSLIFTVI